MAEPRRIEQIIVEFFAKILHIILESRIPSACGSSGSSSSSSSSASPPRGLTARDKWFNLALGEFAYADTEPWRRTPTSEPMVVDVILLPSNSRPRAPSCRAGAHLGSPTVLERWTVQYAQSSSSSSSSSSSFSPSASPSADVELPTVYKKAVIMLRSVYCTARLLPAHRLSRRLGSTCRSQSAFRLVYRVSAWPEPLPRGETGSWSAAPVETPCGKLCVSVNYVPTIASAGAAKEVETSCTATASLVPQIIPDYVGSPAAEQVLRRFQGDSSPVAAKGAHGVSSAPSSPACTGRAIGRCHSWSGGINKGIQPSLQSPSRCLSLSPLSSNPNSRMPPLPAGAAPSAQRRFRIDNSLSPSPSPPTRGRLPQESVSRVLSRTESAPLSAPGGLAGGNTSALPGSSLPPHCRTKKPGLPRVASANSGLTSAYYLSSQGSPPFIGKCVVPMPSELQAALQASSSPKVCKDWKDGSGSPSGVKISSGSSPRITFSRSSSKRSINYEIEDEEFSCPFAIELDNFKSRVESIDGKGRFSEILETSDQAVTMSGRSPVAAVGALVHMLKSAPPLCPDFGNSSDSSLTNAEISKPEQVVGGICISGFPSNMQSSMRYGCKTAADALMELKNYREIKEGLLRQSGTQAVQRPVKSSQTLEHEISGGLWSQGV